MKTIFSLTIVLIMASSVGADYSVELFTVDGGGKTCSGGPYKLTATIGQPDAGYHYGAPYELLGGFRVGGPLCIVTLEHFATFASHWLEGPCDESNDWCDGADLNFLNGVTLDDLTILTDYWLDNCPFGWTLE